MASGFLIQALDGTLIFGPFDALNAIDAMQIYEQSNSIDGHEWDICADNNPKARYRVVDTIASVTVTVALVADLNETPPVPDV